MNTPNTTEPEGKARQFKMERNAELIVDNFAGGGGASTGIWMALGRHVDVAINHNPIALAMHAAKHPQTRHYPEDVFQVDPIEVTYGRPVGLGWFSPDCTDFSGAKNGQPKSKRVRGLAWVALRWAALTDLRVLMLENVKEWWGWGPLDENGKRIKALEGRTREAWCLAMTTGLPADHPDMPEIMERIGPGCGTGTPVPMERLVCGLGYHLERRIIKAFVYGAPTIRERLYVIARKDAQPIVWPGFTHGVPKGWKGRKRAEAQEPTSPPLAPWRTAAECIDFSIPTPSVFLTKAEARALGWKVKRPLVKASCRRVAKGVKTYVMDAEEPFIVSLTHEGASDRTESVQEPWKTVTGANRGEKGLVDAQVAAPFVTEHANASAQRNFAGDEPLRTQCAQVKGGHFATVVPLLAGVGGRAAQSRPRGANEPTATQTSKADGVVAAVHVARQFGTAVGHGANEPCRAAMSEGGGGKNQVVATYVARQFGESVGRDANSPAGATTAGGGGHQSVVATFLAQHNTGVVGHESAEPMSTILNTGSHQNLVAVSLTKHYKTPQDPNPREPLHTQTTKARFALNESWLEIPPLTPEKAAMARVVAAFLREHGVEFEGEFATTRSGLVIWDIGLRMFTPRELYRAQGFPENYAIDPYVDVVKAKRAFRRRLTKTEQIELCGNSVCPDVAAALAAANCPDMRAWAPYRAEPQHGHEEASTTAPRPRTERAPSGQAVLAL